LQLAVIYGQQLKAIFTLRVQELSHMVHVSSQSQASHVGMHFHLP